MSDLETGRVMAIWIKRMKRGPMDPHETARMESDRGIVSNANQGGKRQVTLIEKELWDQVCQELDAPLDPSLRRANILVSGCSLEASRGKTLQIGEVRIQIQGETRPCNLMDELHDGLREALVPAWRGGAYGEVLDDGEIRIGDEVRWV